MKCHINGLNGLEAINGKIVYLMDLFMCCSIIFHPFPKSYIYIHYHAKQRDYDCEYSYPTYMAKLINFIANFSCHAHILQGLVKLR
jgi:hypothetical protein